MVPVAADPMAAVAATVPASADGVESESGASLGGFTFPTGLVMESVARAKVADRGGTASYFRVRVFHTTGGGRADGGEEGEGVM